MKQTMYKNELGHKIIKQEKESKQAKEQREREAFRKAQEVEYRKWLERQ